jgi:hypothetical protein
VTGNRKVVVVIVIAIHIRYGYVSFKNGRFKSHGVPALFLGGLKLTPCAM